MTPHRLATYLRQRLDQIRRRADGGIVDLSARFGKDYPTLREVIAAGALTRLAEDAAQRSPDHALDAITWLPPIPAPEKIICIGVNYPDRNAEYKDGQDAPKYPSMFMRTPRSFVGHETPLVRPRASAQLDYEGEVVLVIGKAGRHIAGKRGARSHRRGHAVQRRHHPRLGPAREVQRDAGQELRFHRQPRPLAGALHRRIADRRHQADDAGQRRDRGRTTAPAG